MVDIHSKCWYARSPWFLSQDPAVFRTRLLCLSGSYRITGWTHRCRSLSLDGYIQDARLLEYNDSSEMPGIASPAWNKRSEGICGCLFWISPYPSWPICPAAVSGNSQRFVRWILRDRWSVFYGTSSVWILSFAWGRCFWHRNGRHWCTGTWFLPTYQSLDDLSEFDREIDPDRSEEIQPDQSHAVPAACD